MALFECESVRTDLRRPAACEIMDASLSGPSALPSALSGLSWPSTSSASAPAEQPPSRRRAARPEQCSLHERLLLPAVPARAPPPRCARGRRWSGAPGSASGGELEHGGPARATPDATPTRPRRIARAGARCAQKRSEAAAASLAPVAIEAHRARASCAHCDTVAPAAAAALLCERPEGPVSTLAPSASAPLPRSVPAPARSCARRASEQRDRDGAAEDGERREAEGQERERE